MRKSSWFRTILSAAALSSALAAGTASAGVRVYVHNAPPRPIVEVRPPAPSRSHIWIGGYHTWDGRAYVWTPGRWDLAPRRHARWSGGHWRRHGRHGWYWVDGRWR